MTSVRCAWQIRGDGSNGTWLRHDLREARRRVQRAGEQVAAARKAAVAANGGRLLGAVPAGCVVWVSADAGGVPVWWPAQLETPIDPAQPAPVTVTLFGDAAGTGEMMHQQSVGADELRVYEWVPPTVPLGAAAAERRARAMREAAALAVMVSLGSGGGGGVGGGGAGGAAAAAAARAFEHEDGGGGFFPGISRPRGGRDGARDDSESGSESDDAAGGGDGRRRGGRNPASSEDIEIHEFEDEVRCARSRGAKAAAAAAAAPSCCSCSY